MQESLTTQSDEKMKKEELGCHIDDVRGVMPHCVIKDVRETWPNPPNVHEHEKINTHKLQYFFV